VSYVHRYTSREDQEVAAILASGFAFGRVAAFRAVLDPIFAALDAHGGPAQAAAEVPPSLKKLLAPMFYRWIRGPDVGVLLGAVAAVMARPGGIEALQAEGTAAQGLSTLVDALRAEVAAQTGAAFAEQSRGVRYLLPRPSDGSACKRWCMFHRWMVRPPAEGVDLGLWSRDPATLVVPVDTHVLRLAQFLGLTERTDGSWRTALEITESLRAIDPVDPVRFDFALAHLGISGACKGRRDPQVCPSCPLDPACTASGPDYTRSRSSSRPSGSST
jgi:uncharacterized protein (TIGR02757 family)